MKTKDIKELLGKVDFDYWVKSGAAERVFNLMKDRMIHLSKENEKLKKGTRDVISEIEKEIASRPQYPNIGKKGCVKRLKEILTS
jgi:hypothetical protein